MLVEDLVDSLKVSWTQILMDQVETHTHVCVCVCVFVCVSVFVWFFAFSLEAESSNQIPVFAYLHSFQGRPGLRLI